MKFSRLYEELSFDDVFPVASDEEVSARKEQYGEIKAKENIDNCKKTKLPDGTWHIHETLDVSRLHLKTLENLNVSRVDGSFDCSANMLTSLKGCPTYVQSFFDCSDNAITSLVGGPTNNLTNYYCFLNQLTTLEGCPTEMRISLDCHSNQLTTLEGCPKHLSGYFDCSNNKLTSLAEGPIEVEGASKHYYNITYSCYNNSVKFTEDDVKEVCKVDGAIRV